MNGTSVEVTGGLGAFLALFFLAVAVIFLGYDLSRRLRRLDQQERLRVEEDRLKQERRGPAATDHRATDDRATDDPARGTTGEGRASGTTDHDGSAV